MVNLKEIQVPLFPILDELATAWMVAKFSECIRDQEDAMPSLGIEQMFQRVAKTAGHALTVVNFVKAYKIDDYHTSLKQYLEFHGEEYDPRSLASPLPIKVDLKKLYGV